MRDEADQARYIVERVLENREGRHAAEAAGGAVPHLSHSGPLEIELTRRNIPFVKFGGLKFLDAAHVKDMLALLAVRAKIPATASQGSASCICCRASDRRRRSACSIT